MSSALPQLLARLDSVLEVAGLLHSGETTSPSEILMIDGDPEKRASALLSRSLAFIGMSKTRDIDMDGLASLPSRDVDSAYPSIVSLSFLGEQARQNLDIDAVCKGKKLPWIRLVVDLQGGYADVGPLFRPEGACYKCFKRTNFSDSSQRRGRRPSHSADAFWSNLLAPSLLVLHRKANGLYPPDGFRRYNLANLGSEYIRRTFLPDCFCWKNFSDVRPGATINREATHVSTSLVYENYVFKELPYDATLTSGEESSVNLVKTSLRAKSFPNSENIELGLAAPLDGPDVCRLTPAAARTGQQLLSLEQMTGILFYTAGLKYIDLQQSNAKRWAASAGNLASPELFLYIRQMEGLTPGLYHYRSTPHDLVSLRLRSERYLQEYFQAIPESDVLFCFTGAYHRLRTKYGPFGYRLVFLDAGVAFSQAALVAKSYGASLSLIPDTDRRLLTGFLNLSHMREYLTAVARLTFNDTTTTTGAVRSVYSNAEANALPIGDVGRLPPIDLADRLYLESMSTNPTYSIWDENERSSDHGESVIYDFTTSEDQSTKATLSRVLLSRRSVRQFHPGRASLPTIARMIKGAHAADAADWPEEHAHHRDLKFFLFEQYEDHSKGELYEFRSDRGSLITVKTISHTNPLQSLYVDKCFQSAPSSIWLAGNLEEATRIHGSYGHQQLLFRAGAAANRLWLTAVGLGFEGTISAGLLSQVSRSVLGFDGWRRLSLCAFLVNAPPGGTLPEWLISE